MKKILVTGASGYVGKYIVAELVTQGYKVFEYNIEDDILNTDNLEKALKNIDAVIHLAAAVRIKDEQTNWDVNAYGTLNLISACEKMGVKRVIFTSSCSVLKKQGAYGKSKAVAEFCFQMSNLNYTIFRPTMIVGKEGKGINNVIDFVKKFPFFIPMVGDGHWTRQPVSIHDLAELIVNTIPNKKTYRKTYPLAGGEIISFSILTQMVASELDIQKKIVVIPPSICWLGAKMLEAILPNPPITSENVRSLTQDTHMDIDELIKDTGFKPRHLYETIKEVSQ